MPFYTANSNPASGLYQLHFHIVTTAAKAAALHSLKSQPGYVRTATKSSPIRVNQVRDRPAQLSYLLKAYWPSKPVIRAKRVRQHRRMPEPYGTQVLLWLDRHRLRDIVLMSDVWSPRTGGPEAGRALYLLMQDGN